jgi:hypothetical protein
MSRYPTSGLADTIAGMGWEFEAGEDFHEGYLVPEFEDGTLGRAATTGGPDGSVHVIISFGDDSPDSQVPPTWGRETRSVAEITGWRVVCDCYRYGSRERTEHWVSPTRWVRVPSPALEDVDAGKIYASDDDVADINIRADVETAALTLLHREHIDGQTALADIQHARDDLTRAQARLDKAVQSARTAGRSWAAIGAAAGMTAQSAHQRWSKATGVHTHA